MGAKDRISQFFGRGNDDIVKKTANNQVNDEDYEDDDFNQATKLERIKKFLFYDVRARIVMSLLLGILLGIGIPVLVYFLRDHHKSESDLGSCMINDEYRFECLINKPLPITEDHCHEANCCWENDSGLSFKCYHSLPSAYTYKAASISEGFPKRIELTPRGHMIMDNLNIEIECSSNNHLSITLNKKSNQKQKEGTFNCEDLTSNLTLSQGQNYFYLTVQREMTKKYLIDTRMGPLSMIDNEITFSTLLPSTKFFGFRGFEKLESLITHHIINKLGSLDMPYYISLESTGHVHAVLIETNSPFIIQGIQAPGFMFHFESFPTPPEVKVNVFNGPTVRDLYDQIHSYLQLKTSMVNELSTIPPYWGLGLHLCRYTKDQEQALEKIRTLFREDNSRGPIIPYDSDCIDENLRNPFKLDESKFSNVSHIISYLKVEKQKKILLTQKSSLPKTIADQEGPEWMTKFPIKYENGSSFIGESNGIKKVYPDFVNSNIHPWLREKLYKDSPVEFNGLVLNDNWPLNEDTVICTSGTRVRESFLLRHSNEGSDKNRPLFGAICPLGTLHSTGVGEEQMSHLAIHNNYGEKTLQRIHDALSEEKIEKGNTERNFLIGTSISQDSFRIGGFSGIEVPFTWMGLKESLAHIVRNFMFLPFVGTPICGSWNPQEETSSIFESNLCFRWFQLGLSLPFARNTYGNDTVSSTRGPTDLVLTDQNNLVSLVKERYSINPYYYTLYYELMSESITKNPPIAPLAFHFSTPVGLTNFLFEIYDQFMIGSALMAAPNMQKGNQIQRNALFPPGKWYDITGMLVANVKDVSEMSKFVQIVPNHLPIFIRGGYIIPTLAIQDDVASAEDSRKGNYTILVTLPEAEVNSKGTLFIDDGISINSIAEGLYDLINFECSNKELSIFAQKCGFVADGKLEISKLIHEIKIFSFPNSPSNVTINNGDDITFTFNEDNNVLRLRNIFVDPCSNPTYKTIIAWTL